MITIKAHHINFFFTECIGMATEHIHARSFENEIFKTKFTIFPDTVQGGTVSKMGPVSPTAQGFAFVVSVEIMSFIRHDFHNHFCFLL